MDKVQTLDIQACPCYAELQFMYLHICFPRPWTPFCQGSYFIHLFVLNTWFWALTQQSDTGFLDEWINDPTVVASPLPSSLWCVWYSRQVFLQCSVYLFFHASSWAIPRRVGRGWATKHSTALHQILPFSPQARVYCSLRCHLLCEVFFNISSSHQPLKLVFSGFPMY